MKKVLALILALVLCVGILAGCEQKPAETSKPTDAPKPTETQKPTETTAAPTEPPVTEYTFPAGTTLDVYPYSVSPNELESHPLTGFLEDATGLDIAWKSYPNDNGILALLTDDVTPSLVGSGHLAVVNEYGRYGAFVNLWDYQEIMPNFFAEFLSENRERYRQAYMLSEDELYCAPIYDDTATGTGFMVRADIMEELKLEVPTDWDSFYAVLKAMKAAYPDSYPFTLRQMNGTLTAMQNISRMFGVNFHVAGHSNSQMRLDRETGKYYESLATDEARDLLRKLRLLVEEELMDPAYLGYDTAAWLEAMASGHAFITYDTTANYDAIEEAGKSVNEKFDLTWWLAFPMVETDLDCYYASSPSVRNWAVTTRCADVELALRFLDWMYTEEARNIMSWGVEGVSYEVNADGSKSFKEGFDTSMMANKNIASCDPVATMQGKSKDVQEFCAATFEASRESTLTRDPLLTYDAAGQNAWDTYATGYMDTRATYIQKFILGDYDINDDAVWQGYKDALAKQGQAEQIAAAEAAYAAMQG